MSRTDVAPEAQAIIDRIKAIDWKSPPASVDAARIERAFAAHLEALGLPARPVVLLDSGLGAGLRHIASRAEDAHRAAEARRASTAAAWAAAWDAARAAAWAAARAAARAAAWAAAWAAARAAARAAAWDAAWAAARAAAWAAARAAAWDAAWDAARAAAWAAAWAAASVNAFAEHERPESVRRWIAAARPMLELLELGIEAFWIGETEITVVIRPRMHLDARQRLHRADGPAVEWMAPDGERYHFWHGVRVPEHVIERPSKITAREIDEEKNAEVRRVMIERYGQSRYLRDSGAELVHRDECGILYRKELPDDEPIVMVRVLNPTPEPDGTLTEAEAREAFGDAMVDANLSAMTRIGFIARGARPRFKEYMLRVPPDVRTARAAVAWTFGLKPSEYRPAFQS